MVTVGFIAAALASVVDENVVRWLWYIPALGLGVAGVVLIRMAHTFHSKTEHHVAARIETVDGSLERIAANIDKLNAGKHSIDTYDVRHRIDELFIEDRSSVRPGGIRRSDEHLCRRRALSQPCLVGLRRWVHR